MQRYDLLIDQLTHYLNGHYDHAPRAIQSHVVEPNALITAIWIPLKIIFRHNTVLLTKSISLHIDLYAASIFFLAPLLKHELQQVAPFDYGLLIVHHQKFLIHDLHISAIHLTPNTWNIFTGTNDKYFN